eukprot:SAG11_NODE_2582_length_3196_cov_3.337100_1_plen_490_part_00
MERLGRLRQHLRTADASLAPPLQQPSQSTAAAGETTPPNILLLVTDQQTHTLLSCAGTPWLATPASDRLAAQGTRFTHAYAANPVCVPSRFSMFTGRMPSSVGVRSNERMQADDATKQIFFSAQDELTLGHVLRRAGYRTFYGGKTHWPLGLDTQRMGFDTFFCRDERERLAVETVALLHGELADGGAWFTVASLINPHDICYMAIRAYAESNEESQEARMVRAASHEILNLDESLLPPAGMPAEAFLRGEHLPPAPENSQPQDDEPQMIGELLDERPFRRNARENWGELDWRLHRWAYARLMERVDAQIGVIVGALDASGQADNTLVILTSDHGDHNGSHGLEHKTVLYDEAARVPWIMRLPGRIQAGAVSDSLVSTGLDLMATCCDFAGVPQPAHCLGVSQRAAAEGAASHGRDCVYAENQVSFMVADRRFKYVLYDHGADREQLYDREVDPGETRNHAADNNAVLERMRDALARERAAHAAVALDQ